MYKEYLDKYNLECIITMSCDVERVHRGKEVRHRHYLLLYRDGDEFEIFIPHYFEGVGTKRFFTKELEKNKLKRRSIKINKLKQRL